MSYFFGCGKCDRTSDYTVFAVGDVVRPGLLTDAVGQGKMATQAIRFGFAES